MARKIKPLGPRYKEASYIGAMPIPGLQSGEAVGLRWRAVNGAELNYRLSREDARRLVTDVIAVLWPLATEALSEHMG